MGRRKKLKPEYYIQFWDEVPSIGSGLRGITLIQVGWKWVKIRETHTGTPAKIRRAAWDALPKRDAKGKPICDQEPSKVTSAPKKSSKTKTIKSSATEASNARPSAHCEETNDG